MYQHTDCYAFVSLISVPSLPPPRSFHTDFLEMAGVARTETQKSLYQWGQTTFGDSGAAEKHET